MDKILINIGMSVTTINYKGRKYTIIHYITFKTNKSQINLPKLR